MERRFEQLLEAMTKRQKKEMERLEQNHIQQFKARAKTLTSAQVREKE